MEVDVSAVHSDQFPDTHSGGCQQVYQRKVTDFGAGITKLLQLLISESFLDQRVCTDFVYSSDRRFEDKIFIFKPGEESGEDAVGLWFITNA